MTPELSGIRRGAEQWLCRSFPNRFPAFYDEDGVGGYQEIMVLSPRHVVSFGELNDHEAAAGMNLLTDRMRSIQRRKGVRHVILFMNCRPMSGASIEHAHFQLVGLPVATPSVDRRLARCSKGEFVELVKFEKREEIRWLRELDYWSAYCPIASCYIGQVRIAPRLQIPLTSMRDVQLTELGKLIRSVALAADLIFGCPAYNIIFQLPPTSSFDADWYIEFLPRFPQMAGLEIGTDFWVNPLSPETAARKYRATMV